MGGSISRSVNRAWRIVATGLSFAVFGAGGLFLGAVVCMAMRLIIHDPDAYAQAVRRLISRTFHLFITFMWLVGVLRWRATGQEHWRRERPYLVIANHPSLIDIVFLLSYFEGADCVVKSGVIHNPAWGLLVRAADYVSNEDPAALLDECARRLGSGRTVVLFPEGTRTVPGEPLQFGSAAGAIAARSGCKCLPVVITCDPPTLYKGLPWYRVPATRPEFVLRVCPPLAARPVTGAATDQRQAAREFTRELEQFFTRQLGSAPAEVQRRGSQPAATPVL
jgi:1-acyl-sn-glycerol-3-phosphate acyltransferase